MMRTKIDVLLTSNDRVASFNLFYELRVTIYCTGYKVILHLSSELLFIAWVFMTIILSVNLGTPWFTLNIDSKS